jgi:S-ribosylhomocysteine lyase LuxS involved in autoinducer biosynthesis
MTVTEEELQRIVAAAVKVALKEIKGSEQTPEVPQTQVEVGQFSDEELDNAMRFMASNRGKGNR